MKYFNFGVSEEDKKQVWQQIRYCMQVPEIPWLSLLWNKWCKWRGNQNYEQLELQKRKLQNRSMMVGAVEWIINQNFTNTPTVRGKKESYKHELTRIFLIYWNSLYYYRWSHHIYPIMNQSIFNYELTFFCC